VSNRVSRRQAGRWAQQEQAQAYQQQQAAPEPAYDEPAAGGGMEDKLALLQQLGQLKEQGVLTEAEFQEQKTRILAS
jgi:hypothetical protein